jgi:3-oxoacyl-[acyl-carrier protein] reductase
MKWNFQDKKVVITGAGSGIGKKIANDFASNGASVAILDLNDKNKGEVLSQLKSYADKDMLFFTGSITDKEFVDNTFKEIFSKWGDVDCLINCAGILKDFMSYRFDEKLWDLTIDVNLKGTALCSQAASFHWVTLSKTKAKEQGIKKIPLLENPPKVIVNISSMVADGNIGQMAYSASKSGLIGMTLSLAKELVNYNVRTHAIKPTLIDTPILGNLLARDEGKFENYYQNRIPFGIGKPEYVSDLACFLCSEGGYFLNGCIIPVNGGKLDGL